MIGSLSEAVQVTGPRFQTEVLGPLKQAFVGKDEVIDLLGVSLVGGENLFILGPPGTAKSALVQALARSIEGRAFDYLLTRFTEPNELFGPFDIRKLREGDLVTNTEGMLPEADLVFLDELLNANSAILNSLLTVLNERVFRRGRETRALATLMVVGASNRLPEDESLGALFDRFLLRVHCDNVPSERLLEVLDAGWKLARPNAISAGRWHVDDVRKLQQQVFDVDLSVVRPRFVELIHRLRHAGIAISDRRAVKLQRLFAASSVLCGRTVAEVSDLWVLRYIWDTDEQQEVLAGLVQDTLRASAGEPTAHPRSQSRDRPDPESLARELELVATRLREPALVESERSYLRDRLGLLANRCAWVHDQQPRAFLEQRLNELWPLVGGRP